MNSDISAVIAPSLIELDEFPFDFLSVIAQRESWRKEIHRPIYHIHKWWANRLGSVFRGILLGCLLHEHADFEKEFYQSHDFSNITVFDPFMGSGTTLGEAHKLGCTVLARDINPIACETVRIAFGSLQRKPLIDTFISLDITVGSRIRNLYKSEDKSGQLCDVLYYFWVKHVPCLFCSNNVDLFSSYIIARNAYPNRKPEIQVYCPNCGDVFKAVNTTPLVKCTSCSHEFNPHNAHVRGQKLNCPFCYASFTTIAAVRRLNHPPAQRLYAKLLLSSDGKKFYLPTTSKDVEAYEYCSSQLRSEVQAGNIHLPQNSLSDGYNTRQALNYGYKEWIDFFNQRQLLALSWLQEAIAQLPDPTIRDPFLTLFSGILEFNNMFTSYKGEGTGAIRHMFSHHILKPERTPIEANVWGTNKSSGSFSTLFKSRLLRAIDYRNSSYELSAIEKGKIYHTSKPFSGVVEKAWPENIPFNEHAIYLSCGSSDSTELPNKSLDLIITDPPFFDNVHYSELADFFLAWQSLHPHGFICDSPTTRNIKEVQDTNSSRFANKLKSVFSECYRIMKDDAILAFTYHHSRNEGWISLIEALFGAGFSVINAHPVKSEMSTAVPKSQTKEPIQLDIIFVCKKRDNDSRFPTVTSEVLSESFHRAKIKQDRLETAGLVLSLKDRRIIEISQAIAMLGPINSIEVASQVLNNIQVISPVPNLNS